MGKKIVRKASVNKRTKQLSITLPKKEMKKLHPTIKFGEDLFVELDFLRNKK